MSDSQYPLSPVDIGQIVKRVAANTAARMGTTITADAIDLIAARSLRIQQSFVSPQPTPDPGVIEARTSAVLQEIFTEKLHSDPNLEISANIVTDFFSTFCKKHPDFYPFCP